MRQWLWLFCGLMPSWLLAAERPADEDPSPVIFHCDFDNDAWPQQWGLSAAPQRTQLVDADPDRKFQPLRGSALRVHVEQGGHYGLSLA